MPDPPRPDWLMLVVQQHPILVWLFVLCVFLLQALGVRAILGGWWRKD